MALRRSGVRIPLGPLVRKDQFGESIELKVMTGVVGHPVSEKGKRGESPLRRKRERHRTKAELACRPQGRPRWGSLTTKAQRTQRVSVVKLVSDGTARYSDQE